MKNLIALVLAIIMFVSCQSGKKTEKENWVQLFNGKDLNDWIIKIKGSPAGVNYKNTFRVEDGVMKVSYSEYEKFEANYGHIFYKTPFSSYRLRVEYRFTGEQCPGGPSWAFRNSGIMFHCQAPETMLVDQDFPVSIEAQFLGGPGEGERPTMNVCTPSTNIVIHDTLITQHCTTSSSKTFHGDVWVTAELEVYGDSLIRHKVNGETVLVYSKPQIGGDKPEGFPLADGTPLQSGYISLQAESHPVEFRKVEILDLSKGKK
ncbi:MAG: DUF1080 domain-containing protein [Bacteroidales bacterium]